jgi:hypothetical protein
MKKILLIIIVLLVSFSLQAQKNKYVVYADSSSAYTRLYQINEKAKILKWKDNTTKNYANPITDSLKKIYALPILKGYDAYFTVEELTVAVKNVTIVRGYITNIISKDSICNIKETVIETLNYKIVNSGNYTFKSKIYCVLDSAGITNSTIKLPSEPIDGETHYIQKTDTGEGKVVVNGNGINIMDAVKYDLTVQYQSVTVMYSAKKNKWYILY